MGLSPFLSILWLGRLDVVLADCPAYPLDAPGYGWHFRLAAQAFRESTCMESFLFLQSYNKLESHQTLNEVVTG